MNRDEIIRMMREAGLTRTKFAPSFQRLVEIAAAAEREACAKVCEEIGQVYVDEGASTLGQVIHFAAAIRARGNHEKA